MNAKPFLTFSTTSAILPLVIGSLTFWAWFFYPLKELEFIGVLTVIISTPLCITGLILAIIFKWKNTNDWKVRRKANRNIILILLNVPFCVFYIWWVSYIVSTERITIVNNTENDITNVCVFGVGDYDAIDKIKKGASHTVWVYITHEGSIWMLYQINGKFQIKSLEGYQGPLTGGHRITRHVIATEDDRGF